MDPAESSPPAGPVPSPVELPPRLRRTLELVFNVEGVTAARVWHWDSCVAVGIRPSAFASPTELLNRVERAVAGLREPEETWDFGLLEMAEESTPAIESHD